MSHSFESNFIFKYSSVDKFLYQNLIHHGLWFNSPSMMNDQFEGLISVQNEKFQPSQLALNNFLDSIQVEAKKDSNNYIKNHGFVDFFMRYFLHGEAKNYRVSSFSRCCDESLLWAHYADKNRGVCLVYDEVQLYNNLKETIYNIKQGDIDYGRKPIITLSENNSIISFKSDIEFLCSKNGNWGYERETRFYFKKHEDFDGKSIMIGAQPLKAIIYGYRILKEDRDSLSDLLWMDEKYRHVKEYEVNIDYAEGKFQICEC